MNSLKMITPKAPKAPVKAKNPKKLDITPYPFSLDKDFYPFTGKENKGNLLNAPVKSRKSQSQIKNIERKKIPFNLDEKMKQLTLDSETGQSERRVTTKLMNAPIKFNPRQNKRFKTDNGYIVVTTTSSTTKSYYGIDKIPVFELSKLIIY